MITRLFSLGAVLLLAACSGSSLEPLNQPVPLSDFTPRVDTQLAWVKQLDQGIDRDYLRLRPLIDGERVFAADKDGQVIAYDSRNGDRQWQQRLQRSITAGPGDGVNSLFIGSEEEVIALDKSDGHELWHTSVSSSVLVEPVLAGELVIVRSVDGRVHALDRYSGAKRWEFNQPVPTLSLQGLSRPLVMDQAVIIGFANGHVVALGRDNGQLYWESSAGTPHGRTELERLSDVDADLIASDGVLYAASYHGKVSAMILGTGEMLWSRALSSYTGMAMDSKNLYVTDENGDLWALSRRNGAALWKQDVLHGRTLSTPVLQGRFVVVGDYAGYLHWFDKEEGHLVGRAQVKDWDDAFFPGQKPFVTHYPTKRDVLARPPVAGQEHHAWLGNG